MCWGDDGPRTGVSRVPSVAVVTGLDGGGQSVWTLLTGLRDRELRSDVRPGAGTVRELSPKNRVTPRPQPPPGADPVASGQESQDILQSPGAASWAGGHQPGRGPRKAPLSPRRRPAVLLVHQKSGGSSLCYGKGETRDGETQGHDRHVRRRAVTISWGHTVLLNPPCQA